MNEAVFDPRRFQSAAAYYEKYRLGYPDRLVTRLCALLNLGAGDGVLDLGCGPGTLAIPLAKRGLKVTALDPEPDMLAAGRTSAGAGALEIDFREGSSYDLDESWGPFRLVTIGRAFHWMDRAATLAMLDRIVVPGGGVALFHDAHPPVPENDWFKIVSDIGNRYGRAAAPHIAERKGGHRRYEPFLFASAFTQLDGLSVTMKRPITVDEIVGRAFSMSVCAPARLGERLPAFEAELCAALAARAADGIFTEVAELVCLLARREDEDVS